MRAKELTSSKSTARAIDEPLSEPASDLLEMNRHAKALADYIKQKRKLPFTVGIFGEWGEGKTTMVNFLKHHLTPEPIGGQPAPFHFVSFSAWPYTTSEKLWRALILEIAKVLYQVDSEAWEKKRRQATDTTTVANNARPNFITRIADFLHEDVSKTKNEPEQLSEFETLLKDLDRADYGKISKRTPSSAADQNALMSAVVNGALSVLGTVSPLVGGIRSVFRWPGNNAAESEAEEELPSEELEALPRFQKLFREILKKAAPHRVYVFIDDLDRAQPDVALDIMESIRIALSDGDCVYILAVDERLIAQGLRLRYRELFAKEEDVAIASKGQEYLEKIIQFRTRVPPRTPEQTQRLIAAEFPHWTPAGDIIQSIVGNNPRRVKQYCQRLGFQNMIGATSFTLGSVPATETTTPQPDVPEQPGSPITDERGYPITDE
jgi:KAP family P-loop domain